MKPRLAFFSFACCEGCQLQVLNCEDEILDLLVAVDIVNFREAMTEKSEDYDIAFVEGSITRESEVQRLKEIRQRAKVLVALGACSCTGGVNMLKNFAPLDQVRKCVYGDKAEWFDTIPTMPADKIVKVDQYVRGCPISKKEFLEVAKSLLQGSKPNIPTYPVCVQCKLAENVCVFDKGLVCMGPITRAGCDPSCPSFGNRCMGCRGLIDNPNTNAEKDVLKERGLTVDDILREFRLFAGYSEVAK